MTKILNMKEVEQSLENGVYPIDCIVQQLHPVKHTFSIILSNEISHECFYDVENGGKDEFSRWLIEAKLAQTRFTVVIDLVSGTITI